MSQNTGAPTHQITAHDPITGENIVLQLPESRLRQMMADSIRNSIVASWAIEGIDISDMPQLDPGRIPTRMLTTQ